MGTPSTSLTTLPLQVFMAQTWIGLSHKTARQPTAKMKLLTSYRLGNRARVGSSGLANPKDTISITQVTKKHLLTILYLRGCTAACRESEGNNKTLKSLLSLTCTQKSAKSPSFRAAPAAATPKREHTVSNAQPAMTMGRQMIFPPSWEYLKSAFQSLFLSDKTVTKHIDRHVVLGCNDVPSAPNWPQLNYLSLYETKKAKPGYSCY